MTNETKVSAKIIERIQALLAMADDTSSPQEATIALQRARKLMDKHQLTMSEINAATVDDLDSNYVSVDFIRPKPWVNGLAVSTAELNDCIFSLKETYDRFAMPVLNYVFSGFKEDIKVSEFMFGYLVQSAERAYQQARNIYGLSGAADKNDFMESYEFEIRRRVRDIINERNAELSKSVTSRALVVCKGALVEERFGKPEYATCEGRQEHNRAAVIAGYQAAKRVHLGAVVESSIKKSEQLEN